MDDDDPKPVARPDPAEPAANVIAARTAHHLAMAAIATTLTLLKEHRKALDDLLDAGQALERATEAPDPGLYERLWWSTDFQLRLRAAKAAVTFVDEMLAIAKEGERNVRLEIPDGL